MVPLWSVQSTSPLLKFLSWRLFNYLWVEYDAFVCTDCGLVISTTDPDEAKKITRVIEGFKAGV